MSHQPHQCLSPSPSRCRAEPHLPCPNSGVAPASPPLPSSAASWVVASISPQQQGQTTDSAVPHFMGVKSVLGLWCPQSPMWSVPLTSVLEPTTRSRPAQSCGGLSPSSNVCPLLTSSTQSMRPSTLVLYRPHDLGPSC